VITYGSIASSNLIVTLRSPESPVGSQTLRILNSLPRDNPFGISELSADTKPASSSSNPFKRECGRDVGHDRINWYCKYPGFQSEPSGTRPRQFFPRCHVGRFPASKLPGESAAAAFERIVCAQDEDGQALRKALQVARGF